MGTNYYFLHNHCKCCDRSEKIHIGKSSSGWTFHFRGYKDEHVEEMSGSLTITSLDEWKEVLKDKCIVNEYGEAVSHEKFFALIEDRREGRNHATSAMQGDFPYYSGEDCWIDTEGNAFTGRWFS